MYDENIPKLTPEEKQEFIDIAFSEDGIRDLEDAINDAFGFETGKITCEKKQGRGSSGDYSIWYSEPLDLTNDPIARSMFETIRLHSFNAIRVLYNEEKRLDGEWVVQSNIDMDYQHTSGGHNGCEIGEAFFNLETAKWFILPSANRRRFWDDAE